MHVLPLIKGFKLESFLNGTKLCPAQFITEGNTTKLNPEFEDWIATDQILFRWLVDTMTIEVSSQMTNASIVEGLWKSARALLRAQIKPCVLMLKAKLQWIRKAALSMTSISPK